MSGNLDDNIGRKFINYLRRFVAVQETSTFYTKELVKQVQPSKRGCLVDDEVKLKYFTEYSRSACEVECATKIMLDRCQCRPYFFRGKILESLGGNNVVHPTNLGSIL